MALRIAMVQASIRAVSPDTMLFAFRENPNPVKCTCSNFITLHGQIDRVDGKSKEPFFSQRGSYFYGHSLIWSYMLPAGSRTKASSGSHQYFKGIYIESMIFSSKYVNVQRGITMTINFVKVRPLATSSCTILPGFLAKPKKNEKHTYIFTFSEHLQKKIRLTTGM